MIAAANATLDTAGPETTGPELSIVIPCLNEADTLETCLKKAFGCIDRNGWAAEVIVADNGSIDGSQDIARRCGARVVDVKARGYGNALMGGIEASHGKYIIMGDADDSYDFSKLEGFVEKLRQGNELVMGCRLPRGGGTIAPGAMPLTHRLLGNPMFSWLAQKMFWMPTNDIYCGLRGFTRELYNRLDLRCTGMEFATEMVIKSSVFGTRISEVPITLHPDGRKSHPPHLRTVRDGWRTLRFFMLCSPKWLFLVPGMLLILFGLVGYGVAMPQMTIAGLTFDAHTLLFASLAILCGYQSMLFAVFAKTFAISEKMLPEDPRLTRFFQIVTLERGVVAGVFASLVGIVLLIASIGQWWATGFGRLDYAYTMRWVIPGVTLSALGFQTILANFFLSILQMRRK